MFVVGAYNKSAWSQGEAVVEPKLLNICKDYKIQMFDTEN